MYPRLTLDLDAVTHATRTLAAQLLASGIELGGVTKAIDGEPAVGQAMLEAGCTGLADSRLPALVRLAAQALAPLTLLRAPQPGEVAAAAQVADRVMLCDTATAQALGERAPGLPIEVLLTVDLGDRRGAAERLAVERVWRNLVNDSLVRARQILAAGVNHSQALFSWAWSIRLRQESRNRLGAKSHDWLAESRLDISARHFGQC